MKDWNATSIQFPVLGDRYCEMLQPSSALGWNGVCMLLWVNPGVLSDWVQSATYQDALWLNEQPPGQSTQAWSLKDQTWEKSFSGSAVLHPVTLEIADEVLLPISSHQFGAHGWSETKGKSRNSWMWYGLWTSVTAAC